MKLEHKSVLLDRCLTLLSPSLANKEKPVLVDATLGLGGHSYALLEKFSALKIIGIDRDQSAIEKAQERLSPYLDRISIFHAVFDQIPKLLESLEISKVDGILFDLGTSSMQLDQSERGFSYAQSAPLDMRMDQSSGITAEEVLNNYSRGELIRILNQYGEERFAKRIVDNIIAARSDGLLKTTSDLADLIKRSIPAPARRLGGNPAKRTFQAIRIEVNQELAILERAIPLALERLDIGARLVVMSFQSLEDKIVKTAFSQVSESKTPLGLPVEIASLAAKFALVFNGSQKASEEEINDNSRAKSVRLRAIERVAK